MKTDNTDRILREVSRSFYLSLKALPRPMRGPVSIAYLLARATDTIADTAEATPEERLHWLDGFLLEMRVGDASWRHGLERFINKQAHEGERKLMIHLDQLFAGLGDCEVSCRRLIQETIETIAGGQRMDVQRFEFGTVPDLIEESDLEDYCHRVAGCVGLFWTRVGFQTLGSRFSSADSDWLECVGEEFGRGLQLVNILRDLPEDLDQGRCYLPMNTPASPDTLVVAAQPWLQKARARMDLGLKYAQAMNSRRLKIAVGLPALIGHETIDLLSLADWGTLKRGVKIDRATVRRCLWNAFRL